jgi:hypothetical protein
MCQHNFGNKLGELLARLRLTVDPGPVVLNAMKPLISVRKTCPVRPCNASMSATSKRHGVTIGD